MRIVLVVGAVFVILAGRVAPAATQKAYVPRYPKADVPIETEQQAAKPIETLTTLRKVPSELSVQYARFNDLLQPSVRTWIQNQARIELRRGAPDRASLEAAIRTRFDATASNPKGGLGPQDVQALLILVIVEAAHSAQANHERLTTEVKNIAIAQQKVRSVMNLVSQEIAADARKAPHDICSTPPCRRLAAELASLSEVTSQAGRPLQFSAPTQLTYSSLNQLLGRLKGESDKLNESYKIIQLALQRLISRQSGFIELASNLAKKSTGVCSICRNLN